LVVGGEEIHGHPATAPGVARPSWRPLSSASPCACAGRRRVRLRDLRAVHEHGRRRRLELAAGRVGL
jgi:hypothetical protein